MLDFMIVGLPRSGTTWASNWLTTDFVHCFHDPLYQTHYADWDEKLLASGRKVGVSCTGIWRWADWVNEHPARKVILHRDLGEINQSMAEIGMEMTVSRYDEDRLQGVLGLHVPFTDLFDEKGAQRIWDHVTGGHSFNAQRHRELVNIEMQPKFSGLSVGPEVTRRLMNELSSIAGGF